MPADVKRLRALELENAKLKRLLTERDLEVDIMREVRTRREAQVIIIVAWRQHYNAVRPHSSIDYLTPHEFTLQHPPVHNHSDRAISQE